jgi:hypothetical protein
MSSEVEAFWICEISSFDFERDRVGIPDRGSEASCQSKTPGLADWGGCEGTAYPHWGDQGPTAESRVLDDCDLRAAPIQHRRG